MNSEQWTKAQLIEAFRNAGLKEGTLVLVHSALRKLGPVEGGADTVIDALLETIGPQGTLVVPTHTWAVVNVRNPVFHQTLTPSHVGTLTNIFRQRPGVIRSLHPTHSLAAIGPRAAELLKDHEKDNFPCPRNGPYGRLYDWGGKILIIGAGLNCCTFFHGCEAWSGVDWALSKEATPLYCIRDNGELIATPMRGPVWNTWDEYPRLEPALQACGALHITKLGDCTLHFLDARKASDWLTPQLKIDSSVILPKEYYEAQKKSESSK